LDGIKITPEVTLKNSGKHSQRHHKMAINEDLGYEIPVEVRV